MKNKILNTILIGALATGSLVSCNFLDVSDELGGVSSFEAIFDNADRTRKWYGQIFSDRPDYSNVWGATNAMANWTGYADEVYTREHMNTTNTANIPTGTPTSATTTDGHACTAPSANAIFSWKWPIRSPEGPERMRRKLQKQK